MGNSTKYHYFVEGKCEKKLLDVLKEQKDLIISGKVEVFNVTQERLTDLKLRTLSTGTVIILMFDTDKGETTILEENLKILSKGNRFKEVWCVMQVPNLEGEIVNATNIRNIYELLNAQSIKDHKESFIKEKNLYKKLSDKGFHIEKMWISTPDNAYKLIKNDGYRIKNGKPINT